MKNILVTGGNGFVGQHLLTALIKEGHSVSNISRTGKGNLPKKAKNTILNLAGYDPAKEGIARGFDIIFHLAGTVKVADMIKNPGEHTLNNVQSTLNILEDIRLNNPGCLLVFMSSDKVYGNPNKSKVSEQEFFWPTEPYGASKMISELLIHNHHSSYGTEYVIFRSGNTFGPGQQTGLFVPSVITQIIEGKDKINVGNLSPYRNFVYVEDAVDAYLQVVKNKNARNSTFNISAYNLRISDVLTEIKRQAVELMGKKVEVVEDKNLFRSSEAGAERFVLDCEKAQQILKWKPKYEFGKAMQVTFKSYIQDKKVN